MSERHRSILVVCEHSWNLLTKEEQAVFRSLSVFHGGFRRTAASQIAGATLPMLAALIDKSLLRKRAVERYEMHDLLRQYAAVKLQEVAEEQVVVCDRHCQYYTDVLFQREEHLREKRQEEALEEIRTDMENVRFAWHWAVIHRKLSAIQRAQQSLSEVYEILGWFQEGAELFGQAAERLEGERKQTEETEEERVVRGHLYARQGWFCLASGQYEQAQVVVHKSLALLHGAGRGEALLFPLTALGMLAYLKGDYTEARHHFEESLRLCRSLGNTWGEGWGLGHVGMVLCAQGQMQEASALIGEALVCSQSLGDRRLTAHCLGFLSQVTAMLGNAAQARALAQESYGFCKDIGYLWGMASALSHVGTATALAGEYEAGTALAPGESRRVQDHRGSLGESENADVPRPGELCAGSLSASHTVCSGSGSARAQGTAFPGHAGSAGGAGEDSLTRGQCTIGSRGAGSAIAPCCKSPRDERQSTPAPPPALCSPLCRCADDDQRSLA